MYDDFMIIESEFKRIMNLITDSIPGLVVSLGPYVGFLIASRPVFSLDQ